MAENPCSSSSSQLDPPVLTDQASQNPNLIPSPSIDIPQISNQTIQTQQQQQQPNLISSSGFQIQRSGSAQRLNQLQQQFGAANVMRQFSGAGQMSFGQVAGQQIGGRTTGIVGQVAGQQIPMLSGQAAAAAHFNLQQIGGGGVMPRQKAGIVQNTPFHTANSSGQTLQGMQALGLINSLGINSQIRGNGPLSYGHQRLNQAQIRQQLSQQASVPSSQKLPGQNLSRSSSLASMNPQLSGLTQNGQAVLMQNTLSQQQWLKQMQPSIPGPVSPSYNLQQQQQRQQQAFLAQQLSSSQIHQKPMTLSQQQISQLVQHQSPLVTQQQHQSQHQQQQQQLQPLQQQQQQQSPRMLGSSVQQSLSLTGSQPDTPASCTTTTGGSSSQGTRANTRFLGKRKIQDLVSQVDFLGKLDPEVEDLLLEIADDFIDSVTTFACSLAKHRKSSTLDSKDILLHLEKNWHLKIPGYTREERKNQRISLPSDIHKKRQEMVRMLTESQQLERDASGPIGTATASASAKQIVSNSVIDRPIKPSSSSEQLVITAARSQLLH